MGKIENKIKIRSTVYPPQPSATYAEWRDWIKDEHKRRWTNKIRQSYGTS